MTFNGQPEPGDLDEIIMGRRQSLRLIRNDGTERMMQTSPVSSPMELDSAEPYHLPHMERLAVGSVLWRDIRKHADALNSKPFHQPDMVPDRATSNDLTHDYIVPGVAIVCGLIAVAIAADANGFFPWLLKVIK